MCAHMYYLVSGHDRGTKLSISKNSKYIFIYIYINLYKTVIDLTNFTSTCLIWHTIFAELCEGRRGGHHQTFWREKINSQAPNLFKCKILQQSIWWNFLFLLVCISLVSFVLVWKGWDKSGSISGNICCTTGNLHDMII